MYSGQNFDHLIQGYYQPYQMQQLSSVYINRNFQPPKPPTVHVNPNFKRQIHINPNFQNANIHVNPSILTSKPLNIPSEKTAPPRKLPEPRIPLISTKNKLVMLPENKTLLKSKYKIVRNCKNDEFLKNQGFKSDKFKAFNKFQPNKYQSNKFLSNNKFKLDHRKDVKKVFKSKFKLDRRSNTEKTLKSRFKLIRKSLLMQLDPQKEIIKQRKSELFQNKKVKLPRTVKIRGRVFRFSPNFESLHLLYTSPNHYRRLTRIVIRGVVYIQKDGETYVRSKTEGGLGKPGNISKNRVKINRKVLKKDNMPCLIYRKTGKCDLHAKGRCFKQHKPEEISVCIRFLQGACVKPKCLLSHKVSPDKLPTCKFYLEGSCCKDDCQYLHVKLSRSAEICKDFLQGFCKNGRDCDKRHQFICPDFEKLGKCRKKSCLYPHGNTVRRYEFTLLNKIARSKKKVMKVAQVEKVEDSVETVRYYLKDCEGGDGDVKEGFRERPKLGSLPEFIPLS